MIKLYEVSRKYIMLFMHNNRYLGLPLTGLLTYFVLSDKNIFREIFHEIFRAKKFHEILHHYLFDELTKNWLCIQQHMPAKLLVLCLVVLKSLRAKAGYLLSILS